ncbi:RICIN domain-containing protein [Ramlibacter sp. XY19]|uniref:RICIN domain-containing protein n=1 Tax=Ramlibacter paludis TaxID=2908000 RepID=UPI0023DA0ACE|nr:RICIN domain-containing protein [Ramlibacter paludis]MCG2595047.1 RICIN domain-containing protein [Ramlibacter paludis]
MLRSAAAAAFLALAGLSAQAADIVYISSASGYLLHNTGGAAVTAPWNGQAVVQGFSGYGAIRINGQCLTGRTSGQPLRWEACHGGDKSQVWALSGRKLNNELGLCADVEGNRSGAGVRVLAWSCSGASNQQWKAHHRETAQSYAMRINDPAARAEFIRNAQAASPGTIISIATGRVVAPGGANVVAPGGANVVSAGGGNVVAAGGLN